VHTDDKPIELAVCRSTYNDMRVVRTGTRVDLDVDGATYATYDAHAVMTGYSWDALAVSTAALSRAPTSVLVLGMGGGTVARQLRALHPSCAITGIEIDADVIRLSRQHLQLDDVAAIIHVEDAYDFLARETARYDVVIDDLFLTGTDDVVRARVPEGATMQLLQNRVAVGGIVVCNLITDRGHVRVRNRARAAFASSFASVFVATPPLGLNEILIGGGAALTTEAANARRDQLSNVLRGDDAQRVVDVTFTTLGTQPSSGTRR
jgi:spermidine synthase